MSGWAEMVPHAGNMLSGERLDKIIKDMEAGVLERPDKPIWRQDLPVEQAIRLVRATGASEADVDAILEVSTARYIPVIDPEIPVTVAFGNAEFVIQVIDGAAHVTVKAAGVLDPAVFKADEFGVKVYFFNDDGYVGDDYIGGGG